MREIPATGRERYAIGLAYGTHQERRVDVKQGGSDDTGHVTIVRSWNSVARCMLSLLVRVNARKIAPIEAIVVVSGSVQQPFF